MIPFQLHRRIPLIRRPFYQLDRLRAELHATIAERDALRAELHATLAERGALRAAVDQVIVEREHHQTERNDAIAERDALRKQFAIASEHRDGWSRSYHEASAEGDRLRAKVDRLYALAGLLMRRTPYRFVAVTNPGRIGHLAVEVDWFLKLRALGRFPGIRPVLVLSYEAAANRELLNIWGKHTILVTNPSTVDLLKPLMEKPALCIDLYEVANPQDRAAQYPDAVNAWGDRPPLFKLPKALAAKGWANLEALGMPKDAWYVCVHARDGVYSPGDEDVHKYRNGDIANCSRAVDEIIARGGWCIRLGHPGSASLAPRPGFINYPDTPQHSDWMDLFLPSHARFVLGNTSGICLIATLAGVPCALANMAPFGACYGFGRNDLSIPARLRRRNGETPSLAEIFASDVSNYRYASLYDAAGWIVEENTEEEIYDLTVEMLDRLDGHHADTPDDEARQRNFRELLTPRHYTYGTQSRIGSKFLAGYASELTVKKAIV